MAPFRHRAVPVSSRTWSLETLNSRKPRQKGDAFRARVSCAQLAALEVILVTSPQRQDPLNICPLTRWPSPTPLILHRHHGLGVRVPHP